MSSAAPCLQEPWTAAADSVRAATMTEEQRLSTANLDERASLLWRIIQDLRPPPHVGQRLPRTSRPLPPLPLPLRSSSILDQRTGTTNTNPFNFLMILEMCSRSRTALPSVHLRPAPGLAAVGCSHRGSAPERRRVYGEALP
jgi:hypothetical protein